MKIVEVKVPPDYLVEHVQIDQDPDECPVCHHKQIPNFLDARRVNKSHVHLSYQCSNGKCRNMFIARYYDFPYGSTYNLSAIVPITPNKMEFRTEVADVSPSFCAIYSQADLAEKYELDLIAGCGYRKSLEFLIKDYLSTLHESEAESIRSTSLGDCIKNWVDDPKIKVTAKRTTWLGNDEVHYSRKWESKDVEDLKALLRLTMNWIESSVLTKKYESEMQ